MLGNPYYAVIIMESTISLMNVMKLWRIDCSHSTSTKPYQNYYYSEYY